MVSKNLHNRLLTFQRQCGSIPLATCHHCHHKLQLITFSPFNLHPMPLDHEDQGLRLKSQQPVMYDNLLAASAARRLSNTCGYQNCNTSQISIVGGYLKVRESLYTRVIIWVNSILTHIDTGAILLKYEGPCMVYRSEWY
jgi:hypothetical protein